MNRKHSLAVLGFVMVILGGIVFVLIAPWVTSAPEEGVYLDGVKLTPASRPVSIGASYHNAVVGREWEVVVRGEKLESNDLIVGGFELGNPSPLYAMRFEPISKFGTTKHYQVAIARHKPSTRLILLAIRTTAGPKHYVLFVMDEEDA